MLDVVFLIREELGEIIVDGDRANLITLRDLIDEVLAVGDLTKYRVFSIKMRSGAVSDKKLRTVGARACVGHRKYAGRAVAQFWIKLVSELVARTATSCACGVASLDHEISNHAVERDPVVVAALGEVQEVRRCQRNLGCVDRGGNIAGGGVECDFDVVHRYIVFQCSLRAVKVERVAFITLGFMERKSRRENARSSATCIEIMKPP